ncbi:hypothetical protein ILUMI_08054 [Ignelater luminosus]|uniref:Uncharacterized protein n=1 Tax=Ignelater luminosus TaxID=2038154 RepID=A0A8K0D6C3_IGNLU|nr:hypothetical protein ILUMI_08054 [Ignelater luminosus]
MFDIIKFLAKQNLALCSHRENDTSANRGNFLELVHLQRALSKKKMGQKISLTYMSPDIRNEFTEILGNKVRQEIIAQVKKAKHYSIFDSTPNIAHKDQTSRVLPYVMIDNQEVRVVESFIDFIETESKTAEGGCKHAVAFLMWLHRPSEEPAPTKVKCYWKKSKLSQKGTSFWFSTVDAFGAKPVEEPQDNFLQDFLDQAAQSTRRGDVLQLFKTPLNIYHLLLEFVNKNGGNSYKESIEFPRQEMSDDLCQKAAKCTLLQAEDRNKCRAGRSDGGSVVLEGGGHNGGDRGIDRVGEVKVGRGVGAWKGESGRSCGDDVGIMVAVVVRSGEDLALVLGEVRGEKRVKWVGEGVLGAGDVRGEREAVG